MFGKHNGIFGKRGIYNTVLTLWAFQGLALRDGKLASCQQAVSDIIAHQALVGGPVPTADTGDYCKARASLPVDALKELACETAARAEFEADAEWFWKGRHAKLVDGPTFSTPPSRCRIRLRTRRRIHNRKAWDRDSDFPSRESAPSCRWRPPV
jgi:putative transposase